MFEICAVITVVGLLLFIVAMLCMAIGADPSGLWITLVIVAFVMMVCGSALGAKQCELDQNEPSSSHEEHIEDKECSYYCSHCGAEIAERR
jgi:hypothetical protein